ncbi:MAG: hypothetical protein QOD49_2176 [Actinomycetota bacterium]|nr:hypothetical protein [Actinomycetota bacterium]
MGQPYEQVYPAPDDGARRRNHVRLPSRRRESLRTTLWFVPAVLVAVAALAFLVTYALDQAVYHGTLTQPWWIRTGSADAGRQILTAIAAAVITVVGVVFSITILALTLASQQFGPRMLRNFIRDRGTQFTLGAFVATFVYAVMALGSITTGRRGEFVPHISITVALGLILADMGVLIYFIHHIAESIQLPEVIAGIAADLSNAIDAEFPEVESPGGGAEPEAPDGPPLEELVASIRDEGVPVPATESGYLQFVGYAELAGIAEGADAVVLLAHRPGHFVIAGRPFATVYPRQAAGKVAAALGKAHATGPHRTLSQDPVFAIDQLVEIAIRALSPAVNDTFTALTCIDWLCDGLCKLSGRKLSEGVYRDRLGRIRLIEAGPSYARMVNRAFDKIRQAGRGMPAVAIRQVDGLARVMEYTRDPAQRAVLVRQAEMIVRAVDEAVPEAEDRVLVHARHADVLAAAARHDA